MNVATDLTWRKSSYSGSEGGNCIEVAESLRGAVPVRDSKDPDGPVLPFTTHSWQAFVAGIRAGDFPGHL
ncbi:MULTISPECIES: DUF397 domain-containing protein [unclassified Kitasatospora]|uniref:DUF397 domain-containing protein n=1 Tax=unclassified Kitasatospora TaxID=2633591 RepID=UPI003816D0B4